MNVMLAETRANVAPAIAEAPRQERKRVVIIGAGFAGIAAARALRHTGSREVAILQCAGLLGTVTAPCASGFTVVRSIAKHIAAMTNVTTLKTCFISAPRISAWRRGDASQLLRARTIWPRRVSSSC